MIQNFYKLSVEGKLLKLQPKKIENNKNNSDLNLHYFNQNKFKNNYIKF